MDIDDYFAPPLSNVEIEKIAATWRAALKSIFAVKNLDVFALFRTVNTLLERQTEVVVRPDREMGRANAFVSKDRRTLFVRQSLIDRALTGDPAAIFDAVHELAHIVLHPESVPLARMVDGNKKQKHIPELNSAEHQANYFTRAFLMSLEELKLFPINDILASECHVPLVHAKLRLEEAARLPQSIRPLPLVSKLSAGFQRLDPNRSTSSSVLPPEIAKLVAWETAPIAEDLDPKEYRRVDERWTIRLSRFGLECVGGWTVKNGKATPWEMEE
jgi:hypothetical protein